MLKLQYLGHLMGRTDWLENTLMLGKIEDRNRRGWQRIRYWMASSTRWTWELDYKESWALNNWCFELWCWIRLLRVPWTASASNQSILKGVSPEYSLEELMLKLKLQYFGHLILHPTSPVTPGWHLASLFLPNPNLTLSTSTVEFSSRNTCPTQ